MSSLFSMVENRIYEDSSNLLLGSVENYEGAQHIRDPTNHIGMDVTVQLHPDGSCLVFQYGNEITTKEDAEDLLRAYTCQDCGVFCQECFGCDHLDCLRRTCVNCYASVDGHVHCGLCRTNLDPGLASDQIPGLYHPGACRECDLAYDRNLAKQYVKIEHNSVFLRGSPTSEWVFLGPLMPSKLVSGSTETDVSSPAIMDIGNGWSDYAYVEYNSETGGLMIDGEHLEQHTTYPEFFQYNYCIECNNLSHETMTCEACGGRICDHQLCCYLVQNQEADESDVYCTSCAKETKETHE